MILPLVQIKKYGGKVLAVTNGRQALRLVLMEKNARYVLVREWLTCGAASKVAGAGKCARNPDSSASPGKVIRKIELAKRRIFLANF